MAKPRFSVVIPTRNRPQTLRSALRTCLAQTFDDFEIVVSDNCGAPQTREVVEEAGDGRVRYVRSDVPLGMSASWEFALSQGSGEFSIILGDDDGLLIHALSMADEMIRELDVEVLTGTSVFYTWPNLGVDHFYDDTLVIPNFTATCVQAPDTGLRDAMLNLPTVLSLPSLYNGFVHRNVLESIRGKNGRIFNCTIPDWYSAIAISTVIDRYGRAGVPFHIAGVSPSSNGKDYFQGRPTPAQEEQTRLNTEAGITWSHEIPEVQMSSSAVAAECIHQVSVHLKPDDARLSLDAKDLICDIIRELRNNRCPIPPDAWRRYVNQLERYSERNGLGSWFQTSFSDIDPEAPPPWKSQKRISVGVRSALMLDASRFGVQNVHDATQLCERILSRGDPERALDWRVMTDLPPLSAWASETRKMVRSAAPLSVLRAARALKKRKR